MTRPIKILIVDDQPRARASLKALLAAANKDVEIGEAADGAEAVRLIEERTPDVVLMDIVMPKIDGVQATQLVKALRPRIKIIVLSMYAEYRAAALRAGADAFVDKGGPTDELLAQLEAVPEPPTDT